MRWFKSTPDESDAAGPKPGLDIATGRWLLSKDTHAVHAAVQELVGKGQISGE